MIRKLPQEVIIKIAAGEVIQRPFNALKQLLENSIDAASTAIHITIFEGGLGRLQIADNGKGIHPDDYPLLCQRFATSKLTTYQDLDKIGSFGFRGEALASLSFVANVEVNSRIRQNPLAYKADFKDGKLLGDLVPGPRNVGTSIKILNLFMNLQTRRKALSAAQEKKKIIKLLNHFALHYSHIRFQLVSEKGVERKIDCTSDRLESRLRTFADIFSLEKDSFFPFSTVINSAEINGVFTKLSVSKTKNKTLVLFVNNRLVEYTEIFKAVEKAYSSCYTSIHEHLETFNVYLSIKIDPKYVDCNIHPTKKQVRIVGSDKLCSELSKWIVDIVKDNCKIKSFGKAQPIIFTQRLVEKREQMGYDKVRTEPSQLPLKYFINEKTKEKFVERKREENEQQPQQQQVQMQQEQFEERNMEDQNSAEQTFFVENNQVAFTKQIQNIGPKIQHIAPTLKRIPQLLPSQKQSNQTHQRPQSILSSHLKISPPLKLKQQMIPFGLSISQENINSPVALEVKQFVQNFTYTGCYNLNYLFIQYRHALLFLNILPFLYPTLINHIKKNEILHIQQIKQIAVYDLLKHLSRKKNLDFDIQGYCSTLISHRQLVAQKVHIYIDQNSNVYKLCYPAECLKGKYTMLQIGYLLARIAKLLLTTGQIDSNLSQKYLVEYFVKLFKSDCEVQGEEHAKINEFMETKIVPLMKTRTLFPEIQISKYFTNVVELKSLYTIFERC